MKFIIGTKKAMTRIFEDDGRVVPVTVVAAGPCTVTQVKTREKDGTNAVQIGYGENKKLFKAQVGHLKGLTQHRTLREFVVEDPKEFTRGATLDVTQFVKGDVVKVSGISKGRGFAGVVKRHGFHGHNATHGTKDQLRTSGSIGAGGVQHVLKGTRMGGRMGGDQATVLNMKIAGVHPETHELLVAGAIPGARNGVITIIAE